MRKFIVLPLLVLLAACTDRGPIGPDSATVASWWRRRAGRRDLRLQKNLTLTRLSLSARIPVVVTEMAIACE